MKFIDFSASFFWKTILIATLLIFASCRKNDDWNENKTFEARYSQDIEKIKASRIDPSPTKLDTTTKLDFAAPVDRDTARYTNSNITVPEHYTSQQFANQNPPNPAFQNPAEMFENNYNTTIKLPFRKIGEEFDTIDVPNQDAYGVKVGMSDKEYLLVSRKLLQKNVDQINAQKTSDDIENSEALISEQRKLKRKAKMIKIFGKDSVVVEEEAKSLESSNSGDLGDKIVKTKAKSDKSKAVKTTKKVDDKTAPNVVAKSNPQQVPASPPVNPAVAVAPTMPNEIPAGAAPGLAPAQTSETEVSPIPTPPLPANNP